MLRICGIALFYLRCKKYGHNFGAQQILHTLLCGLACIAQNSYICVLCFDIKFVFIDITIAKLGS